MKQNQIAQRFEKSVQTYEQAATVQRDMADFLVSRLIPFLKRPPRSILDVGSGTGYVAKSLWEHYPNAHYVLNDLSASMLANASEKFPAACVELWEGDAQELCLPSTELLVSNFCFQWFENLPQTLAKLWKNTKIMAFTTLSEATFGEWREICELEKIPFQGRAYPASSALETMCLGIFPGRWLFFKETKTLTFQHSFSFLRYLCALGAGAKHDSSPKLSPGDLKKMLGYSDAFSVTYEIFMAMLAKEGC
ncbi:MAG: methyltransferase domain-containing protein [Alphaproteobacteria bacterium]